MPKFSVTHIQAVWETTEFEVEASSREYVEENFEDLMCAAVCNGSASIRQGDRVESHDSELTIVERADDNPL